MPLDPFALFGLPHRPWLEPEELKEHFHRLAAEQHPDRTGTTGASAELNAAYAQLREPALRLRHLLELEQPGESLAAPEISSELTAVFLRLATLRRAAEAFAEGESQATTPLAQALLQSERFTLQREVGKELASLEALAEKALRELQALDGTWEERNPGLLRRLAVLQQELTYYGKWQWQLRETRFRLETGGAHV